MKLKISEARWLRRAMAIDTDLSRSSPAPEGLASVGGSAQTVSLLTDVALKQRIRCTAFAFRGYDVTNLGRSRELLEHEVYGPIVRRVLDHVAQIGSEALGATIDLAAHIQSDGATSLTDFAQDVAAIVAMELAQIRILEEVFEIPTRQARLNLGYSIGEMTALICGGVFPLEYLLPIPLGLCRDCAELAADTFLGVLFTRGPTLPQEEVERLCLAIRGEGRGLIGPSAYLSPNTALLLGQGGTLDRVERAVAEYLPVKASFRRNPNRWPPLHSPLVWQRHIPNRTAMALYRIEGRPNPPSPPVISCVSGKANYDALNTRELLIRWTDHPQRLWDVIDETLASGVELIVHVGPAPKLIAATFARLSNNVSRYLGNGYLHKLGRGLAQGMTRHGWLARLLPSRSTLLRAPYLVHVTLEDWLLAQPFPRVTLRMGAESTEAVAERDVLEASDRSAPRVEGRGEA